MKPFPVLIAFIALLPSCASKPKQRITVIGPEESGRLLKPGEAASVRHAETIKAYPVGRYVEPRQRGLMHEAHTVYRLEKSPRWNLIRPTGVIATPTPPPSRSVPPSSSELAVELNRQRQATHAVMQSGHVVSDKLAEMTAALQQNRVLAEQNAAVRKELEATRLRLEALETEVRSRPTDAPNPNPTAEEEVW